MSQIKKLINQKFLEGIDSTKFHVAQNGAIMAKDSSGSMVEFLKVNSDSKGVVLGKVISTKDELDTVIADLAQEILNRQAGDLDAKAYADQKIADLVNGAPALLDTLKELADAIGNDENFAATIGTQLGQLQSDLAAEIARAEAAEAVLSGRLDVAENDIDSLEGRATAVEGRATSLEGRMDSAEESIADLESGLAQEILDREAGDQEAKDYADSKVLEEKGLREAADAQVLVDAKAYTDAEVSEEMSRAEAAESALGDRLDIVEPKVSTLETEMDEAQADISALESRMTTAESDIDAVESGLTQEISNREAADLNFLKLDGSRPMQGAFQLGSNELNGEGNGRSVYLNWNGLSFGDVAQDQWFEITKNIDGQKDVINSHAGVELRGEFTVINSMNAPSPTSDSHVAIKEYVDDQDAAKLQEAKDYADSKMAEEVTAREEGDADTLQSSKDYTDAEVLVEKNRAMGIESGLQSAIDAEKTRVDAILDASQADKDSFAEIVQLINSVDTENDSAFASYVLSNNAALAQEVSDRQTGDSALQSSLDAEVVARSTADMTLQGNINSEQSAREAADVALGGRIDSAEASISSLSSAKADKSYVDTQDAALQSDIDDVDGRVADLQDEHDLLSGEVFDIRDDLDGEISRAQAAEVALAGRLDTAESKISALEALSFHKEFKTVGASDLMHVDLLLKAKPKSVKIYVGRLALHEDHDFTVGENMGVTRIYWTGDFMNLAEEGIEEGMKLFFEYYC